VTLSLFRNYWPLAALPILLFLFPWEAGAQTAAAGSPYSPVFEVEPRGRPDAILMKFRANQVYDTNLAAGQETQFGGTYSNLEADITFTHQQPGSVFMLTYRGGGNVYPQPQYSNLTTDSNSVRAQLRQTITKRLNMDVSADWGSVPGGAFAENASGQQFGSGDENEEFLARRHVSEDVNLALQYQTGAHTYFAWGGNVDDVRFEPSNLFAASHSEDIYGAYFYQFTGAQTMSVGYSNQWIGFPGRGIHAQVHNVLFTYSNAITHAITFNGYVGPAFEDETVRSISTGGGQTITPSSQVNVIGGAALKWTVQHTNIVLRYDRMFTRGSGEAGTSLKQTAAVNFSDSLTRHITLGLNANYVTNDLASFNGANEASFQIRPTFRYHLRPGFWLTATESYVRALRLVSGETEDRNVTMGGVEIELPNIVLE